MGTNYYWYERKACELCGRHYDDQRIHIGKSSGGWCFSIHVIPEKGINSLKDWIERFERPGSIILNEYDETITANQMIKIIEDRHWLASNRLDDKWFDENMAVPGPNNLARFRIDGVRCVGHGTGTYDYIIGNFS